MDGKAEGSSPNLRLIIEKGPLEGHTLEFVAGSKIQIGRIVRGNTVAIKDAGISTKHLAINFEVKSGNWTLSDLGSSNGTVLNSIALGPFSPVQLSDGDTIKIGEYTSIKVGVGAKAEAEVVESKVRRNPRRGRGGKLGAVDEHSELCFGEKIENNENGRGQMWKGKGVLENNEVPNSKDLNEGGIEKMEKLGRKENLRKTRSTSKEGILEDKNGFENAEGLGNVGQDEAVVKLRPMRGRGTKKEDILGFCADFDQNIAEGIDKKQGKVERSKRIARNMRKGRNLESKETEKVLPVAAVKDGENVNTGRITRSAAKKGSVENLEEVGNKVTRKGGRGRRNLNVETSIESVECEMVKEVETMEKLDLEGKEDSPVKEVLEEEEGRIVDGMVGGKEGSDSGKESSGAFVSVSGVKYGNSSELDWEKMTLGDWLDYLEDNLTKQIVDDTEEMILDMQQKAEKFHEFMTQQKNAKRQG